MDVLTVNTHPNARRVLDSYPPEVRPAMLRLRDLILETASESAEITTLDETLKWGEPSYLNRYGSTLRMDWKARLPDHYALYFKCTSRLVDTFRRVYPDAFTFEGNRAMVFHLDDDLPVRELKACIRAALLYHKVKNLPLLGLTLKGPA